MSALDQLRTRISEGTAVVGIYGLGYVGLPLALRFAEAGIKVIGFDVDASKVQALNAGRSYIERLGDDLIAEALETGFQATGDFARSAEADILIICVPTPLNNHHEPDLSFVLNTTEAILPYFREGQLLSLESTTWPGTTEEELAPRLAERGFIPGQNCALVFSPEREDSGNAHFDTRTIPKVIGGMTSSCLELGQATYARAINTLVPVSSPRAAEMTKLLENIHREVNIGLVNEMKIVSDKMGIEIHEVIRAAATKPFGFVPYTPGPGLGGHCIPIDPLYLTWKAKEYGDNTRFIELKGEIMALLEQRGAEVQYSDPHVPRFPRKRNYSFDLESAHLIPEQVSGFDCIVLATDHDAFDYKLLLEHAGLLVDTRAAWTSAPTSSVREGI